jgi:hypothetical protein
MANNVRCAGGGNAPWNLGKGRGVAEPCGWKGERFAWVNLPQRPGETVTELEQRISTAKPCPWCKGRVELIPNMDSTYAP